MRNSKLAHSKSLFLPKSQTIRRGLTENFKLIQQRREKIKYLWSRLRVFSKVIGKFQKLSKEVKIFGSSNVKKLHSIKQSMSQEMLLKTTCLFLPKSNFKKFWNLLIMLLLIYSATILPYRMCFEVWQGQSWKNFELMIDISFFLDVLINFNTALVSISDKFILNRREIAKNYFKTWFLVDLLSCLPFDYLDTNNNSSSASLNKFFRVLRVSRIYKILKIIRIFKVLRLIKDHHFDEFGFSSDLSSNRVKFFIFFLILSVTVHILGCVWYYIGTVQDSSSPNWLNHFKIQDFSDNEMYIASIYFVFTTLTTVGYGDIVPISNPEKIFTCFLMAFGVGFYSFMIGSLATSIKSHDKHSLLQKAKYHGIKDLAKTIGLSIDLRKKIKKYFCMNAAKNHENLDFNSIVKTLPSNLREEILGHVNLITVKDIYFFYQKPVSFINYITPKLKLSVFNFQDVLYEEDDPAEEMYFIRSGRVCLKSNEIIFRLFTQGSYFGEIEIIDDKNRNATASIASIYAELLILTKSDFLSVFSEFSEIYEEFKVTSKVKKFKHDESKEKALNLFESTSIKDSFLTDEANESLSEPSEVFTEFIRKDTGTKISFFNDNEHKRKNRKLWSEAIGKNVQGFRGRSSTMIGEKNNERRHSQPFYFKGKKNKFKHKRMSQQPKVAVIQSKKHTVSSVSSIGKNLDESLDLSDCIFAIKRKLSVEEIKAARKSLLFAINDQEFGFENQVIPKQIDGICKNMEISLNSQKELFQLIVKLKQKL